MFEQTTKRFKRRKLIGIFGDINFLEYGGGIVYRGMYPGFSMVYFERRDYLPEEENTPEKWFVYECDLDPLYINWAKLESVYESSGIDENELSLEDFRSLLKSENPMDICSVFVEVARYEGWSNLDFYPQLMTKTEINKRFGRWVR